MSERSVRRYKENIRVFGTAQAPRTVPGPARLIENGPFEALIESLTGKPDTYRDETVVFLWDEFEVLVSVTTVFRALKGIGWNKKVVCSL